jgi:hypothetical protein
MLDNINDNDLDLLAEAVIKRLTYKFKQEIQHETPMNIGDLIKGYMPFKETKEEFLIAEMARLHTLLALYEGQEEFYKAAIIQKRLEVIQEKLNNL